MNDLCLCLCLCLTFYFILLLLRKLGYEWTVVGSWTLVLILISLYGIFFIFCTFFCIWFPFLLRKRFTIFLFMDAIVFLFFLVDVDVWGLGFEIRSLWLLGFSICWWWMRLQMKRKSIQNLGLPEKFAWTWVSCRNMVLAGKFLLESGFDDEEDEDLV